MFTIGDLREIMAETTAVRELTEFEKLLERAAIAAAKAMDAAMELEAARKEMAEILPRAADAAHSNPEVKAAHLAVWRESLQQLTRACAAVSGP